MSFNGTPFNDDQLDHMRSIATLPDNEVSWCGWGRVGPHCCANPDCRGKKEGLTLVDKKAVWCPDCHNYPWHKDDRITHRIGCAQRTSPATSTEKER